VIDLLRLFKGLGRADMRVLQLAQQQALLMLLQQQSSQVQVQGGAGLCVLHAQQLPHRASYP
jgi:hypothetical protein